MFEGELSDLPFVLSIASLSLERMSSRHSIFFFICLFPYNMPSLSSFFLTVFLSHFAEVEAKH